VSLGAGAEAGDRGLAFTPLALVRAGADRGAGSLLPLGPPCTGLQEMKPSRVWLGLFHVWPRHGLARAAWWQWSGPSVCPVRPGSSTHPSSRPGHVCVQEMCHAVTLRLEGQAGEVRQHGAVLRLRTAGEVGPLRAVNSTGCCHTQAERGAETAVCE